MTVAIGLLKVYGPISQVRDFYSNDELSHKNLGLKFDFNRSNGLDTGRDYVHCNYLYLTVQAKLNYGFP